MHDPDTNRGLGSLYPGDAYERKAAAETVSMWNQAQAGAAVTGGPATDCAVSARSRSPYEVRDDLCKAANKYHAATPEYRLLYEAADLIFRQENQIHEATARAHRAEHACQSFNDKIHLALLALRSPTVD